MTIDLIDYDHGISALDSGFHRPRLDAIHLMVHKGRAAIVDTGTAHSVPRVLDALAAKGLSPADVDYVILTHIHLDHAGGAGALMRLMPAARLVVHPRGVRHMADPSRLWEATVAVYGLALAQRNYGVVAPVDPARIVAAPDAFALDFGGRTLTFHDTPGHARHHVCIHDAQSGHVFTGDTFGLGYVELETDGRRFCFPTSSPTQFDPPALHASIDRIAALAPGALYLTHYAQVTDVPRIVADLHRLIDDHAALAARAAAAGLAGAARQSFLEDGVAAIILAERDRQGWRLSDAEVLRVFEIDHVLNAQGLGDYIDGRAA
ncbi:MAG: MBL fold metallo-hydrolase [Burkholderiales bacterium]|nr:MBL fold metallo-hydrolase [Burkholderiales bacterium]